MKSDLLNIFNDRGFIYQCTDLESLDELFFENNNHTKEIVAYIGFDCTARSLHIGSLLQIMMLSWLEKLGFKPIVLLGGGTSLVGDPSEKDKARIMLSQKVINDNFLGIKKCIEKFLPNATIVNNADWLCGLNYLNFLRNYGIYFSVNQMINYDSVKQRLSRKDSGLSFLEFNYMILQAYDFVYLAKNYNCKLQLGGSDQWGNIINGIELGKRLNVGPMFGLTSPLITNLDGSKMGKTAQGTVWLDEDLLSSFDYWQYWRNVDDKDVIKFLKMFTFMPLSEIAKFEVLKGKDLNDLKKTLATEATKICHGITASNNALAKAENIFENQNNSSIDVFFSKSSNIVDLLVEVGFASSNSEARRDIQNRSIRINDVILENELKNFDKSFKLSFGKKKHLLIKIN